LDYGNAQISNAFLPPIFSEIAVENTMLFQREHMHLHLLSDQIQNLLPIIPHKLHLQKTKSWQVVQQHIRKQDSKVHE
jgi:hypothetical protein